MTENSSSLSGWRLLDEEHHNGISHNEGICAWCDHVRQLDKEGYYEHLKKQKGEQD